MSYEAPLRRILAAFGLSHTAHLPAEGVGPRIIDGWAMWIEPLAARVDQGHLPPNHRKHHKPHRVKAECPACGRIMSAGRIRQHVVACDVVERDRRAAERANVVGGR